jgi:hypothetical protein
MEPNLTSRDLRDARVEHALADELRTLPPDVALARVRTLIGLDAKVGLRIARRVLRGPGTFETLLREGLAVAGPGSVKHWIESTVASVGFARLVRVVRERVDVDPRSVGFVLYWLPQYAPDEAATRRVDALREDLIRSFSTQLRDALAAGCTEEAFHATRCPLCHSPLDLHVRPDGGAFAVYCRGDREHVRAKGHSNAAPPEWWDRYTHA